MKKNEQINVLSLFSGCGGMDLGLEGGFLVHEKSINQKTNPDFIEAPVEGNFVRLKSSRFQTVFANDILEDAATAWRHHFKQRGDAHHLFHLGSIVDLVKQHRSGENVFPEQVDVVTGGFPCQDFSLAGKRRGFNSHKDHQGKRIESVGANKETRGQLYIWMKEVIEITKPKIFIAENVKGLVNLEDVKEIIQDDFSRADQNGYIVLPPKVLHAADYGVPQSRERVIFIGIKKSALNQAALAALSQEEIPEMYNPYPKPSHAFSNRRKDLINPQNLKNIFSHLQEPEQSQDYAQKYYSKAKYMGSHCQGQIEINLKGIAPTIRAEHHGNIEFRRLSPDHGGIMKDEWKKGWKERRLTPRECALIQTFPPDYEFVIPKNNSSRFLLSPSGAYKLIGNAVPPLLAFHIGQRIESLWNLYFGK